MPHYQLCHPYYNEYGSGCELHQMNSSSVEEIATLEFVLNNRVGKLKGSGCHDGSGSDVTSKW